MESGANATACDEFGDLRGCAAIGDEGGDTCLHGAADGLKFRLHSADGKAAFFIADMPSDLFDAVCRGDEISFRIAHAIDGGEENEHVCLGEHGQTGGKFVIVSDLQFVDRDGVIFVDDRNDISERKKAVKGIADVFPALGSLKVAVGEENLSHMKVELAEKCLVIVHQAGLSDRAAGLKGGEVIGSIFDVKRHHPGCCGSAGNYDAVVAVRHQSGDSRSELMELIVIQRHPVGACQDAGAKFDNDLLGGGFHEKGRNPSLRSLAISMVENFGCHLDFPKEWHLLAFSFKRCGCGGYLALTGSFTLHIVTSNPTYLLIMIRLSSTLLLSSIALAAFAVPAKSAVTLFSEYHLGEAGSLNATNNPQDSSGNSRHFSAEINGMVATVGTAGVFAPGSSSYLDTAVTSNEGWYGANHSSLATDNFAFGIYARASSNIAGNQGDIFTVGGGTGAFKLSLAPNGWGASSNGVSWIGGSDGVSGSFADDAWVHLALIRSGGSTQFYINGTAQGGAFAGVPTHGDAHASVSPGGGSFFDGHLDEARVVTFTSGENTTNILNALQGIPEPSTSALFGLAGLAVILRRRR